MSIWFSETPDITSLNRGFKKGLATYLDINLTTIGDDWLSGTLPVTERTHQPMGLLHGGASVVLAETLGSVGSYLCIDPNQYVCVGQEINASHLRSAASGLVTGTARALRIGRRSHVWQIDITDEQGAMICVSRLSVAVIQRR